MPEKNDVYSHLAQALAQGYIDLYYVNTETEEFIEFHSDDQSGALTEVRKGQDFYARCVQEAGKYVHPEDRADFIKAMSRDHLSEALDGNRTAELIYRRIKDGAPGYVQMKISRMEDDKRFVVIAVSDIDELMRQRRAEEQMQEERVVYARLHALTGNFFVVYVVDPETNSYREFSATDDYVKSFAQAKEGTDFFGTVQEAARLYNDPDDLERFLEAFTKENVLAEIERSGLFTLDYSIMKEGKPFHIQLKAAMVEEKEGPRLVVGLADQEAQYRRQENEKEIARQREIYNQITASLAAQYDTLYYIDLDTNTYREISSTNEYKKLNVPATGNDFFAESRRSIRKYVHPEDQEMVLNMHYKDAMLGNLKTTGSFSTDYRRQRRGQAYPPFGNHGQGQKAYYRLCPEHRRRGAGKACPESGPEEERHLYADCRAAGSPL